MLAGSLAAKSHRVLVVQRDQLVSRRMVRGKQLVVGERRRDARRVLGILMSADVEPGILLPSTCGRINLPDAPVLIFQNVAHRFSSPRINASRSAML